MCAIFVIDPAKKIDRWLFYSTFLTIEEKPMFSGDLHECVQVLIMLFIIMSVDDDIICNPNYAFAAFQNLVHHLLKDVLGAGKATGEMDKSVMSPWGVECHEEGGFIVEDDTPVGRCAIQLHEAHTTAKLMGDLIQGWGTVVVMADSSIEILGVLTDP